MELLENPDSKDATTIPYNTEALEIVNHFERSMTISNHGQTSSTDDNQVMAVQLQHDNVDEQQPQSEVIDEQQSQPDDVKEQQSQPDDVKEQQSQPDDVKEQQSQPDDVEEQQPRSDDVDKQQSQPDDVEEQQPRSGDIDKQQSQPDDVEEQQPRPDNIEEQRPQPDGVDEQQLINPGPIRQAPPNQIANMACCQGNQLHLWNCMYNQLQQLLPIQQHPPLNLRRQNGPRIMNQVYPHHDYEEPEEFPLPEEVHLTFNSPNLETEISITTSPDTRFEELFFTYFSSTQETNNAVFVACGKRLSANDTPRSIGMGYRGLVQIFVNIMEYNPISVEDMM